MILRDDIGFNMDSVKRALVALRERTETSYYVHDLRQKTNSNALLQHRGVIATGNKIAFLDIKRNIEINDGDIVSITSSDGRVFNYYVFDVQKNRFTPDKFTMHAILWSLPVSGFGLCGKTRYDDLHGRRNVWLESAPQKIAV